MAESITAQELKELLARDRKTVVIDVRRKTDFDAEPERIVAAERRDPEDIDQWIGEVPQGKPVVVYCVKGGSVSQSIADRLQQSNPEVRFLQGGIKAWKELGGPLEG